MVGDREQPGPRVSPIGVQRRGMLPGAQQRLVHDVLGALPVAVDEPQYESEQRYAVLGHTGRKALRNTPTRRCPHAKPRIVGGGGSPHLIRARPEDRRDPSRGRMNRTTGASVLRSAPAYPTPGSTAGDDDRETRWNHRETPSTCLLYTSDAADEEDSVDLGGRRIIKKKK